MPYCNWSSTTLKNHFETRVCDNNPSLCSVTLRTDFTTACQGQLSKGNLVCDGKPVIETRLHKTEWNEMHPKPCSIN